MTIEVVKTALSDVVLVDKGKGQSFVIPLTEIDRIYVEIFKIRREYRPQIDEALTHKAKQTEEIMRLLEPTYAAPSAQTATEWNLADAREFNKHWSDFESDLTAEQRVSYLELSQKNKQKAFDYWMRTQGGHVDYSATRWYQFNYEK